jgi:hypothetical protein
MKNKSSEYSLTINEDDSDEFDDEKIQEFKVDADNLFNTLKSACTNSSIVVNCLIDYFYVEKPNSNKDLLWESYGKFIFKNIKNNTSNKKILFPFPSDNMNKVDLQYLGYDYILKEIIL